ncbi:MULTISPECIES: hypothetical protein [Sphingobium]|uniref:hypothetical protein n=1 Tax=Sphingobium TaxID=165695 RepID=UPI0007F47423|nr:MULTISPECIES: hypothetical protein [Sphingobium]OAN51854.1 hypothetical protein A7Q26_09175 [Sphingobium sp. TCM1]QWT15325.1 hypothetical protein GTV57_06180 [Sphingobium xenophagum]
MRNGMTAEWLDALEASGIQTALMGYLDFASEPCRLWTGWTTIQPMGSGDIYLDNFVFDPIENGVPIQIGENTFSYQGSDELEIALAVPDTTPDALVAASLDSAEYKGRRAIIWRALMISPANATTPAVWSFRRVRSGAMDKLAISFDGQQRVFKLTIESHSAAITNASASTYLDQPLYDPADTSQAYAVSIANDPRVPGRLATGLK